MKAILERLMRILERCENDTVIPPTALYNEGWMLRLVLDCFSSLRSGHPLAMPVGCKWYSEALLPSAFLAESRDDMRAESWTHADGVIGHFEIGRGAKGNLSLSPDATHFVVLEAKMFSKLSQGTKNAKFFNQAARNVACMAEAMRRAQRQVSNFSTLAFYVLAPKSQIESGLFEPYLQKESIRVAVEARKAEYEGKRDDWFTDWFLPLLSRVDVKTMSWEGLIEFSTQHDSESMELRSFYARCLEFNRPARSTSTSGCEVETKALHSVQR